MRATNQLLIFENHGEIDPRLITTLGVNVKEGDSPIGYFGTGLKYALAVALRLGCKVTVQSGLREFRFRAVPTQIRGKEFQLVEMADSADEYLYKPLAFTLDLGKNWQAWMAFREFECNALDEGGASRLEWDAPEPTEGVTRVIISGQPLVKQFFEKKTWQSPRCQPLIDGESCQIFPSNGSRNLYYRGVKVMELPKAPLFTYNVLSQLKLTEDRTVNSAWDSQIAIAAAGASAETAEELEVAKMMIGACQQSWEHDLDWCWHGVNPTEAFARAVQIRSISFPATTSSSALVIARWAFPKMFEEELEGCQLTSVEEKQLAKALQFLSSRLNVKIVDPIQVVEKLGEGGGTLGMAKEGKIWLARECFARGTKQLAGTIFEEHVHLQLELPDLSRAFQNFLIDKLMGMGEELQGEPL